MQDLGQLARSTRLKDSEYKMRIATQIAQWARGFTLVAWVAATSVSAWSQVSALPAAPKPANFASIDARLDGTQADPALHKASVARGAKVAAFCANCHGPSGNSALPEVPNLAGQNSSYLMTQMKKFADGRRKDPFMGGMIKAMSDQERVDVVLYYVDQEVGPQPADNPALVARGKYVYEHNCFRCHGAQGLGNSAFPRLARQQKVYLAKSLRRYRDGSAERIDPLMADSTKLLSDDDITAVTAYVASLQ